MPAAKKATKPPPKLVYPQRQRATARALQRPPKSDLHPTLGLAYNWALDFMAPGGTPVLAVEEGTIWKLSGHDPAQGVVLGSVFGWNVYLHTKSGLLYFYTHLGVRNVKLGQKMKPGGLIGYVGNWPGDPGRSHTHLGVTHPVTAAASKAQIVRVSKAPILGAKPKPAV